MGSDGLATAAPNMSKALWGIIEIALAA